MANSSSKRRREAYVPPVHFPSLEQTTANRDNGDDVKGETIVGHDKNARRTSSQKSGKQLAESCQRPNVTQRSRKSAATIQTDTAIFLATYPQPSPGDDDEDYCELGDDVDHAGDPEMGEDHGFVKDEPEDYDEQEN